MQSHAELVSCSEELVRSSGSISASECESFLQKFPISFIFELFQRNRLSDHDVTSICSALDVVLLYSTATPSLGSSTVEYANLAIGSKYKRVRELGAQFLWNSVEKSQPEEVPDAVIATLFHALGDEDVGVGSSATKAMKKLCCSSSVLDKILVEYKNAVEQLISSKDSARLRMFETLLSAAAFSEVHYSRIEQAGVFNPLIEDLNNYKDPLSCLCAWSLFREIACESQPSTIAESVCKIISPHVSSLLEGSDDVSLLAGMLSSVAPIIGKTISTDSGGSARMLAGQLLSYFDGVLRGIEECDSQLVEAVLDAAGQVGMMVSGAKLFFGLDHDLISSIIGIAFSATSRPETRRAGLHSLAAIAGVDWGQSEHLGGSLLPREAEIKLENALSTTAAGIGCGSPGELFWQVLRKGTVEDRIAVYRALSALVARPWFAGGLCACIPLFNHLTFGTEPSAQTTEWRYACTQRLLLTARHALEDQGVESSASHRATLVSSLPKLQQTISYGPFRPGSSSGANHIVATQELL